MELAQNKCRNCGGTVIEKNGKYICAYCYSEFDSRTYEKEMELLNAILDKDKQEKVANLRQLLWKELQEKYTDSREIVRLCKEIKAYLPEDFYANFYEVANSGNAQQVNDFLDGIDAEEHYDDISAVLRFMIKSLKSEYMVSVCDLLERAYRNNPRMYDEYRTLYDTEARKVDEGVYNVNITRDVFLMYSSKDMPAVKSLTSYLESQGLSCFVAMRNLQQGRDAVANYQKAIEQAIDNCKVIVFLSSTNSRSLTCDAVKLEMPYIKNKDKEIAPAEYRYDYTKIPDRYKHPRVEYLLEAYNGNLVERQVKEFFGSLQWCTAMEAVGQRVVEYLFAAPETTATQAPSADVRAQVEETMRLMEAEAERRAQEKARRKAEENKRKILIDFEVEGTVVKKYLGDAGEVFIPTDITEIADGAFRGCSNLTKVTLPNSVIRIGNSAFSNCNNLTSITIPGSVRVIGNDAFYSCINMERIVVDKTNTVYHSESNCLIETATATLLLGCKNSVIPADGSVKIIGRNAFSYCKGLTSITIPNAITEIQRQAFSHCSILSKVIMGSGVTSLGSGVFFYCDQLENFEFSGSTSKWNGMLKGINWNFNCPFKNIVCNNGTVRII